MSFLSAAFLTSLLDPSVIIVGLVAALCWREGWKLAAFAMLLAGAAALTAGIDQTHRVPLSKGLAWALILARSLAGACWAAGLVYAIGYRKHPKRD